MNDHVLLYIDPDAATRLLVQKALCSEGFGVLGVRSACEAQHAASLTRLDLAVVDVDRVRAADLVPALRRTAGLEHVRLLASTAYTWPAHLEKMLALGFDRVLLQPYDIDALGQELRNILPPASEAKERIDDEEAPAEPVSSDVGQLVTSSEPGVAIEPAVAVEEAVAMEGDVAIEPPVTIEPAVEVDSGLAIEAAAVIEVAAVEDGVVIEDSSAIEPAEVSAESAAVEPLDPVTVPLLWRLALSPLTASLVRSTAAAEGMLALYDDDKQALIVVAVAAIRHAGNGAAEHGSQIGARVPVAEAGWLHRAVHDRQTVVVAGDAVAALPLVPAGSQTVLAIPVASREAVHGVAVVVKHRAFKAPTFNPDRIARGVAHGEQIAGIVEMLHELTRAADRRRRELQQARIDATRALLTDMSAFARHSRKNGAGRERAHADGGDRIDRARAIGVADQLAERFALPAGERETLRQALEVWDVGLAWAEHVLFPRATFSVGGRERLLETYSVLGAEILTALDWPPAVVELVRTHQLAGPDTSMPARIMAVATAFVAAGSARDANNGSSREGGQVSEMLAALDRDAGTRYDPDVVAALSHLCFTVAHHDDASPNGGEPAER